jgi:hypothetical protein
MSSQAAIHASHSVTQATGKASKMSDTCGHMSGMPLARWNLTSQSWRTCVDTSLWDLPMSSVTLPAWGYLRDGALFEQPMPERLTIGPDCSSLPTPRAQARDMIYDRKDYHYNLEEALAKLPTPTAQAAKHTLDDRGPGTLDDHNLWSVLGRLLPTPAVNDMGAGKEPQAWQEWAARQKAADGRPAPHGKSLEQEAIGVSTRQQSHDGKSSQVDERQPQLFTETSATD